MIQKAFVSGAIVLAICSVCLAERAVESVRAVTLEYPVIAKPQAKCEKGFVDVQLEGEQGWFQTTKKCQILDTTHAGENLTQAQLNELLKNFLSGHPQPQGAPVCCCNGQVYNNSNYNCHRGKLVSKSQ